MKKKLLFAAILILVSYLPVQSQISLRIGPMAGLTSPTIDYSGDAKDFYAGTKYGMRSGLNYGVIGKILFGPVKGRVSVSYASLDNSGPTGEPNGSVEIKNNLFMFTIGTEFMFGIPASPVKPYAGIDLLISSISGEFNFSGSTPHGLTGGTTNISSSSRTGLGFAVGSEIGFGKSFMLDLSLRYNLINLFGKEYTTTSRNNRTDVYAYLNDAKDPGYVPGDDKHIVGNDRTIATIQLQLGVLFGF